MFQLIMEPGAEHNERKDTVLQKTSNCQLNSEYHMGEKKINSLSQVPLTIEKVLATSFSNLAFFVDFFHIKQAVH